MPIYEYACEGCGEDFEVEQRITADPVKSCPACKSRKVKRLISQTSFVLKGGGWYSDLYSSPKSKDKDKDKDKDASQGKGKDDKSGGDDSGGSGGKSESKKSSKSAPASDSGSGSSKNSSSKSGKGGSGSKGAKAAA